MTSDLVQDVRDIRLFLEERWQQEKFDFTVPRYRGTATYLFQRSLPPGHEVLPLLERIADSSVSMWGTQVGRTYSLVHTLIATHSPSPMARHDAADLDGFLP